LRYSWARKLLGWREDQHEGHTEGFSEQVYKALREVVFPFPKVKRDALGQWLPPSGPPCTCTIQTREERMHRSLPMLVGAAKRGWIEFFQCKGYLDNLNRIIWETELASHLSSFSFNYLLAVANCGGDAATSSSADPRTELCLCRYPLGASGAETDAIPSIGTAGHPHTGCYRLPVQRDQH
jgi:hypothetical protein